MVDIYSKDIYLLTSLCGQNGLINGGFQFLNHKRILPSGLYSTAARGKNLNYIGASSTEIIASSIGFTLSETIYRTLGEYIERLTSSINKLDDVITGSYTELNQKGLKLLNPAKFSLFAKWQLELVNFKFTQLGDNDSISWIKGRDFFTKEEIYLPSELMLMANVPGDISFSIPTSTGKASSMNVADALESSFLEITERHAWCDLWYNQNKQQFITYDAETILRTYCNDKRIKVLFNNDRVSIKVFDLGYLSPVETCVVFIFFSFSGKEYYSVGAASKFSKVEAIIKACCEAYQGVDHSINATLKKKWDDDYRKTLYTLDNFDDNFIFYNYYPLLMEQVPIFVEAKRKEATNKEVILFNNKIDAFREQSLSKNPAIGDFYYVDITIEDWQLPFKVVSSFLPDFALMSPYINAPYLGHKIFDNDHLFLMYPNCFP